VRAIVVGISVALFAPSAGDQIFRGRRCYIFTDTEDMTRTRGWEERRRTSLLAAETSVLAWRKRLT
jgi:hypothetical protein